MILIRHNCSLYSAFQIEHEKADNETESLVRGIMIKKILPPLIILIFFSINISADSTYYDRHKDKVDKQHKADLEKRDRVLRDLDAFLHEGDSALSDEGLSLKSPVEPGLISNVGETTEIHAGGVIVPKIYGYVTSATLNMRSEDSGGSPVTGKLKFKDKVEIIYQSDRVETINGMRSPWLLVRRGNGDEGWVFGGYISDSVPSEPDRDSGKTDWNMVIPASGKITSRYGKRVDPVSKRRNTFHRGIDIAAPEGTPVYAAEDGVVVKAEFVRSGYGNLVVIKHADNVATYYGHLSKFEVKNGRSVKRGDLIARIGSTGKSTGPHLHFEIRRGDQALDPEQFIR